ncbi:hypothetical protein SAMN05660976_05388 [Nonomuraea pusilla]|uniref:Uncharacterized protein n=1 Tax=Nonomuraea pusilla TaxID=46177 RepID=A0A1H7Z5Q6_9ACTN|nr:hypothetical protein SAMN05660976_05388 [Nonomuraea pusilla]
MGSPYLAILITRVPVLPGRAPATTRIPELKELLAEEGAKIERIQNAMKDETGVDHVVTA